MSSIDMLAPAKVNLFLKVLDKRKDSYHNILTLFERVSLADKIRISKIPKGIAVSSDKFITRSPKDNLVYKAARLILDYRKINCGVSIKIKKTIPVAAGLGGGSSDAASVLIGVDRLYGLGLSRKELMRLASKLGADVGFFILNTSFAVGRSRGDLLRKVGYNDVIWHIIIHPGFKISTKDIYEAHDVSMKTQYLTTEGGDDKIQRLLKKPIDFNALEEMLYNDLQEIAVSKSRVIGNIIERLASSLGKKAIVSGSGPSVFCLYKTRRGAITAKRKLYNSLTTAERKGWQIFVAGTLN